MKSLTVVSPKPQQTREQHTEQHLFHLSIKALIVKLCCVQSLVALWIRYISATMRRGYMLYWYPPVFANQSSHVEALYLYATIAQHACKGLSNLLRRL